jgi:arylsulfatase A-like enzyme
MTEHIDVPPTILDYMNIDPLPVMHGSSLRAHIEGQKPVVRGALFSEYLENEEAHIRTARHKYIFCSGNRKRGDGYLTDNPTPGRYHRLFDLEADPGEFTDVAANHPKLVEELQWLMLGRFRATHPEAAREPQRLGREEAIEWYLRPRDDTPSGAGK